MKQPPKLLTKGAALLKARDLLGPSASVYAKGSMKYIGVSPIPVSRQVGTALAAAHDWESALMLAERRVQDFFRNMAEDLKTKAEAKEANTLAYEAWKAKREARFA
jgi:hypothetical protein